MRHLTNQYSPFSHSFYSISTHFFLNVPTNVLARDAKFPRYLRRWNRRKFIDFLERMHCTALKSKIRKSEMQESKIILNTFGESEYITAYVGNIKYSFIRPHTHFGFNDIR